MQYKLLQLSPELIFEKLVLQIAENLRLSKISRKNRSLKLSAELSNFFFLPLLPSYFCCLFEIYIYVPWRRISKNLAF